MSAPDFIFQSGRKLNDQYFIIKARAVEGTDGSIVYHAYSPRTSQQYVLPLTKPELAAIVGDALPALYSESVSDRKAAHQAVIDSLQFEDRMLAHPASPSKAPSGQDVLAQDAAVGGAISPSKLQFSPPLDTSGTLVLRVGRKINGNFHDIECCVVEHAFVCMCDSCALEIIVLVYACLRL